MSRSNLRMTLAVLTILLIAIGAWKHGILGLLLIFRNLPVVTPHFGGEIPQVGEVLVPSAHKLNELAGVDASMLLRAMSTRGLTDDSGPLYLAMKAEKEVESLGDIGLTVKFDKVKLLTTSEWILHYFGATGEFYVITSVFDGSGSAFDHTTKFFPGLRKDEFLPLGEGGMVVSFLKNPHWFVDVHMLVMESDSDLRDFGSVIEEARENAGLNGIVDAIKAAGAFDPTLIGQITPAVNAFLDLLQFALKKNKDDHVATLHDFYLKHQAFGSGRHPSTGLQRFQKVELAYTIDLVQL